MNRRATPARSRRMTWTSWMLLRRGPHAPDLCSVAPPLRPLTPSAESSVGDGAAERRPSHTRRLRQLENPSRGPQTPIRPYSGTPSGEIGRSSTPSTEVLSESPSTSRTADSSRGGPRTTEVGNGPTDCPLHVPDGGDPARIRRGAMGAHHRVLDSRLSPTRNVRGEFQVWERDPLHGPQRSHLSPGDHGQCGVTHSSATLLGARPCGDALRGRRSRARSARACP